MEKIDKHSVDEKVLVSADAAYRPFPKFKDWDEVRIDVEKWNSYKNLLSAEGDPSADKLARARDAAKRAAAIDTGAIEGLYDLDAGITITIATQSAMWEAKFGEQQARTRALIECQLAAYDFVIDFATRRAPIIAAWIRSLHQQLCSAQKTYLVQTPGGQQEQKLVCGAFKDQPNHVLLPNGEIHSYAPVIQTPIEMERLCQELESRAFQTAHPVIQSAYAHHVFSWIHPFQDGNGRVARALASVFLYRDASIPLLILVEHRQAYLNALRLADKGNYQVLCDFVLERSVDAFLLIKESLKAASVPNPTEASQRLNKLFTTKGGYTHASVDIAAKELLHKFSDELHTQFRPIAVANQFGLTGGFTKTTIALPAENYRFTVSSTPQVGEFTFQSTGPVRAVVKLVFGVAVPKDCDVDDPIMLICLDPKLELLMPASKIIPNLKTTGGLLLSMFVQRVLGVAIQILHDRTKKEFTRNGY